jgi:hypothetical protein
MRIPLYFLALWFSGFAYGQIQTTGLVPLDGYMSFKLDKDTANDRVTLTLTGPANRWFALAFNAELMLANTDCVVMTSDSQLTDSYLPGGHNAPVADLENDWTLVSNTVNDVTGVRSIEAYRMLTTGHAHDYDFSVTPAVLHTIWAYSSTPEFVLFHHGADNYGGADVTYSTLGLNAPDKNQLKVYPNPADQQFTLALPIGTEEVTLAVYNELGQTVYTHQGTALPELMVSSAAYEDGVYYIKVTSEHAETISRLIVKHS